MEIQSTKDELTAVYDRNPTMSKQEKLDHNRGDLTTNIKELMRLVAGYEVDEMFKVPTVSDLRGI